MDNDNLPIAQETRLRNVHVSGSLRETLTQRGQSVSRRRLFARAELTCAGAAAREISGLATIAAES